METWRQRQRRWRCGVATHDASPPARPPSTFFAPDPRTLRHGAAPGGGGGPSAAGRPGAARPLRRAAAVAAAADGAALVLRQVGQGVDRPLHPSRGPAASAQAPLRADARVDNAAAQGDARHAAVVRPRRREGGSAALGRALFPA
eukprot:scaffold18539_cov99-Isochrysis_galbana.AAC.3